MQSVRSLSCALLAAAAMTAASCGDPKPLPFEPGGGGPDPDATFSRVQGEVFSVSCAIAGCHVGPGPAAGLDLGPGSSYAATVRVPSSQRADLARIEPYEPDRSYLIKKVRGDADVSGSAMPLTGTLSVEQRSLLVDWVRRGAPLD